MADPQDFDVELPDGRIITVEGAPGEDAARQRVTSFLREERRNAPRTGSSLARGVDELQGSLYSAVEGVGQMTGINMFERFGREGRERNQREAEQSLPDAQRQSFEEAETTGDYARAAGQALGTNAPNLAASLGAIIAGTAAAGPAGGLAAGLAVSYPQLFGANRQRQLEANPNQPVDNSAAALTAVPQAAMDVVSDRILLGLGRAFGQPTAEAGQAVLTRIARGLGIGVATEVPTEVAQQALERAQAGLDVFSPDAMREYRETAIGAGVVGGTAGATIAGVAGPRPQVTPVRTPDGPETPPAPETFGPTGPTIPPEPTPITDVEEARRVVAAANLELPEGLDDTGLLAAANLAERARYRDEVAAVRTAEVARFTGLSDVIRRAGEPDNNGNPTEEVDVTRGGPTLVRNMLEAMGSGLIEGDRFTLGQVVGIPLQNAGFDGNALPADQRNAVAKYLDGLVDAGYLESAGKIGKQKAYRVALQAAKTVGASPVDGNLTADERAAQAVLPALEAFTTNPMPSNQEALQRAAAGTQIEPEIQKYLGLVRERDTLGRARDALAALPTATDEQVAALRSIETNLNGVTANMARIVDAIEGRARGTAIAIGSPGVATPSGTATLDPRATPGAPPSPSAQVGRATPATANLTGDELFAEDQARGLTDIARGLRDSMNTAMAPILSNPNPQIDEAQIANRIAEQPNEAVEFLRNLIGGRPQGAPLMARNIQLAARERGLDISPQTAIQLYNVARMQGLVNRTGVPTAPGLPEGAPRPANFQRAESPSPQRQRTPAETEAAIRGATRTFDRMVGSRGRLEIRDKLLLSDLSEEIQQHAAELGITEIDGIAIADLAILSLANPDTDLSYLSMHEGFHVADYLGLITANEREILNANRDKILAEIKKYMSDTYYEASLNSLAEMRANGINARIFYKANYGTTVNNIMDKIVQFVERIGNFLRGRGFTDWRQIYDRLYAGDFANRPVDTAAGIEAVNFVGDPAQINSPEFRRWFQDSAVKDENGSPLLVYHAATRPGFDKFDTRRRVESLGSHFGTITQANSVAYGTRQISQNVPIATYPVYLRIRNPLRMDDIGTWYPDRVIEQLMAMGVAPDARTDARVRSYLNKARIENAEGVKAAQDLIKELGYDGIVYKNEFEAGGGDSYIVFDSNQVKSAIGNSGAFSPRDNRINFARAGTLGAQTARVQQATVDELKWPLRWFGSPMMTIGKLIPSMRGAADTMKQLYTRTNEMITSVEPLHESAVKLTPESRAKITRVWDTASRTRKAPNLTGLNAAERDALREQMEAVQKGLSFFIESSTIQNFLPTPDKTPALRAKLEAFWQRHTDKHLWEISDRELMAASPEGYREIQKLERLRNPYYMPQVGRGSHFVAAYKRKPNGDNGELVALVAYEPLNMRQRFGRQPDQEKAAIAQLRAEFPDATKHNVMQQGRQFTNDGQEAQIRASGDFIAQYMERIRQEAAQGGNTAVLKAVRDMTNQMDKAQIERIFRPNNNILRAVTPQNESSYITDVMPQYILSLAKVQAHRYTQDPYKDATKALSPNDKAYWDSLRNYATSPSEAFGNLRALAFFQYLGGAIDTAFINLTQNLHTNAMLARDGGLEGSRIFAQVAALMSTSKKATTSNILNPLGFTKGYLATHATPAEKVAIERAMAQGIFAPVFTNESRSQFTVEGLRRAGFPNPQKAHKFFTKATQWAGLPMQLVESYNRAVAFTAAFKLATQNPNVIAKANQVDGTQYKTAYDYAVGKVLDTQFLTTKEDRALFQRFTPAAELATQFLSYPFKAMEVYAMSARQAILGFTQGDPVLMKAGATNLLLMVGPLVAMAGLFALPFADFAKEFAEDLIRVVWGRPQNFEMDMREALGGGRLGEVATGGLFQAYGIASLRRRVAIDPVPYDDLMSLGTANMVLGTLFGPVGSMAEIPQKMYMYYQNGDYMQMAAAIAPRAIGNVIRGAQVAIEEEQRTLRGNRVITPEVIEQSGTGAIVPQRISAGLRQAAGFAPPEFGREREIVGMAEEINQATRSRSERVSKELARILVNMMEYQRDNRMDDAARESVRYGQRLQEIMQEEMEKPRHLQITLQQNAIVRRAYRDFHGIASEEALQTTGRRNAREEVLRQRALIDWRNQQPQGFAEGGLVRSSPETAELTMAPQYREWLRERGGAEAVMREVTSPDGAYNYGAAVQNNVVPERYEHDNNRFHWPSVAMNPETLREVSLKMPNHPTGWMEDFMRVTGVDPHEATPEDWERARPIVERAIRAATTPGQRRQPN